LPPSSRLHAAVDALQQLLVDASAAACGLTRWRDPWRSGAVRAPWWLPSSAALDAQRAAVDAARRAADRAALVEPPLKVKERLDRKLTETRAELDAAMRARNFMQCLALQKAIDQLKFDRKNIPGLSEEIIAVVKLQGYCRALAAKSLVREKRFLKSLPPPPWQTHVDPRSGVPYYFNPYTDGSTWQLVETGDALRAAQDAAEATRRRRAVRAARAADDGASLDTVESCGASLGGGGKSAADVDDDGFTLATQTSDPGSLQSAGASPRAAAKRRGAELLSPELRGKPPHLSGLSESEHEARQAVAWPTKPRGLVAVQLAVPFDVERKVDAETTAACPSLALLSVLSSI
jgi:hypothetical protein